jgi:hypothetical protein
LIKAKGDDVDLAGKLRHLTACGNNAIPTLWLIVSLMNSTLGYNYIPLLLCNNPVSILAVSQHLSKRKAMM